MSMEAFFFISVLYNSLIVKPLINQHLFIKSPAMFQTVLGHKTTQGKQVSALGVSLKANQQSQHGYRWRTDTRRNQNLG